MSRASLKAAIAFVTILVTACGGGGGGSTPAAATTTTSTSSTNTTPTGQTTSPASSGGSTATGSTTSGDGGTGGTSGTSGTAGGTTSGSPGSTPAAAPFIAAVTIAPAEGASVTNTVTLEVRGSSLENVELLPPDGYSPRLGVFTISPDKTVATLNFDTNTLPNGTLRVRISAFNQPSGSSGASEIVAMTPRNWLLRNSSPAVPTEVPSASYMPEAWFTLGNLPRKDPAQLNAVRQMDDASFADMLANRWAEYEAILRFYVPVNVVFVPPTPLNFQGAWAACLRDHGPPACREAMIYLPS